MMLKISGLKRNFCVIEMIWALDLDEFTGSCGCGKYPLLTTLTTMNQELQGIRGSEDFLSSEIKMHA